ncbi:hypothetical protein CA13_06240 [Planctomycetes bacterium CA13]|uniref:General secretion pathway protein M n=1 Tax=Novipirellula herctigrandis TaxID=2527986 RepID=A0A5C5YWQ8_9BACT|nr:hypothetical protein CA13_06240 [Planctomycetes bacterium CA13]
MNKPNNRAIRAIVASVSLLVIIAIGTRLVDEYLHLRQDAITLSEMGDQFTQAQQQAERLQQIESKIQAEFESATRSSIDPETIQDVRSQFITIIRNAGGRLRTLEISEGRSRPWAFELDDPRNETMPQFGEESAYDLHAHEIELRVEGSLETVTQVLRGIADQHWYMITKNLVMMPTDGDLPIIAVEARLIVYGLVLRPEEAEEEFALERPNRKADLLIAFHTVSLRD